MRKLGLLLFVSFFIGCSSESDGDSPDMPMNSVDQGMNDMSETVDAMIEVSTISVEPDSLTIPESTPGMPVRVSFAVNADGSVASITNVTMTINGGIARLFYRATSQIGIDTDGEDRFDYPINVEPGTALPMMLEVAPSGDAAITGSIEISGNFENSPMSVSIEQGGAAPEITVSTNNIEFGRVPEETTKTEVFTVTNSGAGNLELSEISLRSLGIDFSLTLDGNEIEMETDPSVYADPDGDGTPGLSAGASADFELTYAPMSEGTDEATVVIRSNSVNTPEINVSVLANPSYSCLETTPETMRCEGMLDVLTFCPTQITVSNCDPMTPLIVDEVRMSASTDAFAVDADVLPSFPHVLDVGESFDVSITYRPGVARSNHRATLVIHGNDLENARQTIGLTGFTPCDSTEQCPTQYECIENQCVLQEPPADGGE